MSKNKKREAQKLLSGNQRPRKFMPRTKNQAEYLQTIKDHTVTLAMGPPGTGKTFLAVVSAVNMLKEGVIDKIVLTRPAVEAVGEKLGALPGDLMEKIDPYMVPLYESLEKVIGQQQCKELLFHGAVEVVPLAYMRGRTLDAFVILDEAQNTAVEQVKMLMTRLGPESKLVITGDLEQSDISNHYDERKDRKRSGLEDAVLRFYDNSDDDIAISVLTEEDIQRHPLIRHIIRKYRDKLPEDARIDEIFAEIFEDL